MDVQCKFRNTAVSKRYCCEVQDADIKTRAEVKTFVGDHQAGLTNKSVEIFSIRQKILKNIHFLPKGINNFFPNLVEIWIYESGLREIFAESLFGLECLETIDFTNNKLKALPADLLMHTRKLKSFTANEEHLINLDPHMFDSIPQEQWEYISLTVNQNRVWYSPGKNRALKSMKELKDAIKNAIGVRTVDTTQLNKMSSEGFKTLWRQKKFSDFAIIAGTKTFPVHKAVLAACSPELGAMIENDDDVKATNKLEIKNCNEEFVKEFLQCLYTGEINEDGKRDALDLYSLAATFGVAELKSASEVLVLRDINEENATKALTLGNEYNSQEIINEAFHKIKEKYPEIEFPIELKHDLERIAKIIETVEGYRETMEKLVGLKP